MEGANGYSVKKGMVYRADHLSRLPDNDHRVLHQGSFRTVCDLRSRREQRKLPDRMPGRVHSIPLLSSRVKDFDPATAMDRLRSGYLGWLSKDFILHLYRSYLDDFGPVWRRIYSLAGLADHLPLVFHCTGGKDRTGICSMLLHNLLGVKKKQSLLNISSLTFTTLKGWSRYTRILPN